MNSLQKLLLTRTLLAAAVSIAGLSASGVAWSAVQAGSPDDGMQCRSAPTPYTGSFVSNKFFCKRTLNASQALTCPPAFPTKFIREGPNEGGKDVCAASGRVYPANVPLTGTVGVDYVFPTVGSTQVSTIVANQRQNEATALGLTLADVDAKALTSAIVINHTGSEDRLQVNLEFATYAVPAPGSVLGGPLGNPVSNTPLGSATSSGSSTIPFSPRPLP